MINVADGALVGSGQAFDGGKSRPTLRNHTLGDERRAFEPGDRIGVRLDLGDGSLLFFKNGRKFGPGYGPGSVRGPLVCAMILSSEGDAARLNYAPQNAPAPQLSPRPAPEVSSLKFTYVPVWRKKKLASASAAAGHVMQRKASEYLMESN
jgi:hypothetical protein